jgi:superfamily I DNA/RNA helicase
MSDFKPTDEQTHAIDNAGFGETFVLDACAGSGKTTTARQMCEAIDGEKLYLVYNSAAAQDAKKSFPKGVRVSTTSALAWHKYPEYQERMNPRARRVKAKDTALLAGLTQPVQLGGNVAINPVTVASWALETIQKFCYSSATKITEKHTPAILAFGLEPLQEDLLRSEIVDWARKIWVDCRKLGSKHRFTYDYAFKLLVMSPPDLGYDAVIIDEAQDSNYATLHLLKAQINSQLIAIGDPAQQLYGWRGASDIMGEFDGDRLTLSQSFRFGERIAEEADKWLAHTQTNIRVRGNPAMDSRVVDWPMDRTDAVLCRNNATVMGRAIDFLDQNKKVAIVGGTEALRNLAFAARDLMNGKRTSYAELSAFSDWGELMAFTEEPGGGDLKALVQLVNQYKVNGILDACNRLVPENPGEAKYQRRTFVQPDVVISTAHKSKGREWLNVEVADDFKEPDDVEDPMGGPPEPGPISRHEAMLHYVTVTRARETLNRSGLSWIDRHQPVDKLTKNDKVG